MNLIDNLSSEANQLTRLILPDGTQVDFNLIYRPTIGRWMLNVSRGTFSVDGLNICVFPNLLSQWRELIPFGLACVTTDGADPVYIDDFSSGRAQLFLLTQDEVASVEATILGVGV